jgi:hypothetical protein
MNPSLGETVYLDFITSAPSSGAAADADGTPTVEVFENATSTPILSPTATKRTSKTGDYVVTVACTTENGFEVGKSYNVIASATVGGVPAKCVVDRLLIREYSVDGVNLTHANGSAITNSDGTAQGGASGYIILAADSSDTANYYQWSIIRIIGGTGQGQARVITFYDEETKQANVIPPWAEAPTNDSVYVFESCGAVNTSMIGGDDDAAAGAQDFFQDGDPTSSIAEAVVDQETTGHTGEGTVGGALSLIESPPSVEEIVDGVMAELFGDDVEIDTGISFKEHCRATLASAIGKRVVDGSNRHLRNPADTKNRITYSEDRATVSTDLAD